MSEDYPVSPPKMLEAMGSIQCGKHKKKIIMEVIGEKGLAVGEYVDRGDKKVPYQVIEESYTL